MTTLVLDQDDMQLLSEGLYAGIEQQRDTLEYARNHMEDYEPGDVERMLTRLTALTELKDRIDQSS